MRAFAAVKEPRFHTAKPKPSSRLRASVSAPAFASNAAPDWVASTARPMAAKARMPSRTSIERASNAAWKARLECASKARWRDASLCVALTTRMPRTLSWIHDVSALLRSLARRKAWRSGDENFRPRKRIGATVKARAAASHRSKAATTASAKR